MKKGRFQNLDRALSEKSQDLANIFAITIKNGCSAQHLRRIFLAWGKWKENQENAKIPYPGKQYCNSLA